MNNGTQPRWRSDGRELYFVDGGVLMAVPVSTEPAFTLRQPQRLFESADLRNGAAFPSYDVSADGQKFVTIATVENAGDKNEPPKIRVVENWFEEFRNREHH